MFKDKTQKMYNLLQISVVVFTAFNLIYRKLKEDCYCPKLIVL